MLVWGRCRPGVVRCGFFDAGNGVMGVVESTLWWACNALLEALLFSCRLSVASWPLGLGAAGTACGRSRVGPAWPRL